MSYSTEVIDAGKGILHIGRDTVSGNELLASANRILDMVKKGFSPSYAITDLGEVVDFHVTAEEIRLNAEINISISKYLPRARIAIIASRNHIYGIARMWEAYAQRTGWAIRVFRDKNEALAWVKAEISDE